MKRDFQSVARELERFAFLFHWLRLFYPCAKGIPFLYLLYFFIPQKILRLNGRVPWPVHFTSRVLYRKNISVGNRSAPGMNAGCYIQGKNGIRIGHNLRMGPGVGLISANHDLDDYDQWTKTSPIRVGDNVWIGMNAVILPGVTIGDNIVIAANSVVNEDIPSDSIAAGNPCKVIRKKAPYRGKSYGEIQ
jgi:acetyltransferase-like isoleucine patch superfamily enzyme